MKTCYAPTKVRATKIFKFYVVGVFTLRLHFSSQQKARYHSVAGLGVGACHIDRHLLFVICFAVVASS
jgi:hypothetical protein